METTRPISTTETEAPLSPWRLFWQRLKRRRIAMFGGVILIVLYLVALFAGFIAPYGYQRMDNNGFFHSPTWPRLEGVRLVVPRYQEEPGTFNYHPVAGDTRTIHFFVRGYPYKWCALIPGTVHMSGTGDKNYPVYLLGA